ncbi:hypothetical protein V6N11_008068 [Hibiscus sabdariffa]|uniref:Uncharacterized protein n=1 Tax=Hibiscus sabdariffa TaxID=183260 RepID=A0ABR2PZI8_9ROSI
MHEKEFSSASRRMRLVITGLDSALRCNSRRHSGETVPPQGISQINLNMKDMQSGKTTASSWEYDIVKILPTFTSGDIIREQIPRPV